MPEASIDAIVTDPPYGLSVEPDIAEVLRHWLAGDDYQHRGGGFMGRSWDSFVPGPAYWREAYRVLKPGGHLLAFSGTRTEDLLGIALRLAGFERRDTIAWLYGSGFPKSLNAGKAMDTLPWRHPGDFRLREAAAWTGYGSALKPAHEPIVVARKPLTGSVAANVLAHGTGALNVSACRILTGQRPTLETWENDANLCDSCAKDAAQTARPTTSATRASTALSPVEPTPNGRGETAPSDTNKTATGCSDGLSPGEPSASPSVDFSSSIDVSGRTLTDPSPKDSSSITSTATSLTTGSTTCNSCGEPITTRCTQTSSEGRWPPNVALDEQAAAQLDAMTGTLSSNSGTAFTRNGDSGSRRAYGTFDGNEAPSFYGDSGGASRFLYVAKASSAERNAGLDGFEEKALRPDGAAFGEMTMWNGQNSDEAWRAKNPNKSRANVHPTVKPISLMRWLVRLVTPPGGTLLDPFAGSGTTGIAAALEGFDFIGIEREAEYAAIAEARIAWWARHPDGMTLVKRLEAEQVRAAVADAGQTSIFDVLPEVPLATAGNGRDGEASAERRYTDNGASNFAMKPGRRRS